jgi:hypothetical protein
MMDERDRYCPDCSHFICKTNAPWGWILAYCRICKKMRSVKLGKPPQEQEVVSTSAA